MKENKDQVYFSTLEAAELLKVSRISVFNWIQSGKIQAEKIGRNYAISRESLEAVMGSRLTQAQKTEIDSAVKKAMSQYRDTFERLAKE